MNGRHHLYIACIYSVWSAPASFWKRATRSPVVHHRKVARPHIIRGPHRYPFSGTLNRSCTHSPAGCAGDCVDRSGKGECAWAGELVELSGVAVVGQRGKGNVGDVFSIYV
jgi:hypothetical protein